MPMTSNNPLNPPKGDFKERAVTGVSVRKLFMWLIPLWGFGGLLSSCNSNRLYEENIAVQNEQWDYDDVKEFSVMVEDTSIRYNILINLRHSFAFDWRNLYVKIATEFPDGKKTDSRVNLLLSEPDGRWYARCIGDNCFISIPVKENIKFPQKGKYMITIRQDMRQNPLSKIKYVGFRIERAEYDYSTTRLKSLF